MAEPVARASRRLPLAAAAVVLALAAGALFWPRDRAGGDDVPLFVFDTSHRDERVGGVYEPLARALADAAGRRVPLRVLTRTHDVRRLARLGPCFLLVPDGLAVTFAREEFAPIATGRRVAPHNLRPRGVLVWRRAAGNLEAPWRSRPARTVLGDSVSLTANGPWALGDASGSVRPRVAAGPDPYDHGPVLQAARLGGFDYAVVRQWDAERFFDSGLLDAAAWGMRPLTPPVPDLVLLAPRALPARRRLAVGDALAGLGRQDEAPSTPLRHLAAGLDRMGLAGFNLLIDADFDQVRGEVRADWLHAPE